MIKLIIRDTQLNVTTKTNLLCNDGNWPMDMIIATVIIVIIINILYYKSKGYFKKCAYFFFFFQIQKEMQLGVFVLYYSFSKYSCFSLPKMNISLAHFFQHFTHYHDYRPRALQCHILDKCFFKQIIESIFKHSSDPKQY